VRIIKEGSIPAKTLKLSTVKVTCQNCNAKLEINKHDVHVIREEIEPHNFETDCLWYCPCCGEEDHRLTTRQLDKLDVWY